MALAGKILVVDDDDDIRATVCEVLRDEGYDVVDASNGERALAYLETADELPALILLDLMMPRMSGEQFAEIQRASPRLSTIPLVVVSASGMASEEMTRGAREVLRKPVTLDELLAAVRRAEPQ